MKKIYFLAAAMAIAFASFGREAKPVALAGIAVLKSSATSYKLIYKSELQSDVSVRIFDSANSVVFSEVIKMSNGFARPYSFETLPDGRYTIRVDNGSNWLTETIEYKAGKVEKLAHLTALPGGRYLLSVPGDSDQLLSVYIYDETGKIVYRGQEMVNGDFAQVYKIEDIKGGLTFEVADNSGLQKTITR